MNNLLNRFEKVRAQTEKICAPLETEDYSVQPMVDVSPPKWHLAHSTWFFEQFVLSHHVENYKVFDDDFAYLFNSYYNNVGERVLRPNRGLMTRPTVKQVYAYRKYVTEKMVAFLQTTISEEVHHIIELGINHEEQHQELVCYDIKYILGNQPFFPAYQPALKLPKIDQENTFIDVAAGNYTIGNTSDGFAFDNELGVHTVHLEKYAISSQLVTNADYMEFIADGGYKNFNFWHAEGWDFIQKNNLTAPLYWHLVDGEWQYYDFTGLVNVNPELPVTHISYYEAYAFAEWKGMRLPTEFEWEVAADKFKWGAVWEWTGSAYLPYPNFTKKEGALGEYNGKFMVSQHVLRGGSIATPENHTRKTYRNFFHPQMRWLFAGIRLAK